TQGIRFPVARFLAFGLICSSAALGVPPVGGEAKMYWTNQFRNKIQRANRGSWQGICFKEPGQGNGSKRPTAPRKAGAHSAERGREEDDLYNIRG
ncbi:MAG: hypothetical protein O7A04_03395, partial [Acidobacteria bacterium]|nr:hypothetical protein [Acidobacteriota bacterium]